jgi:TPR repeat protein
MLDLLIKNTLNSAETAASILWRQNILLKGVEALIDRDFVEAYTQFELISSKCAISLYHMACMTYKGQGTPKNFLKAVELFKITAPYIPNSIYNLAQIYKNGTPGIPVDEVQALAWMSIIAIEDDEFAKEELSLLEESVSHEIITTAQKAAHEWIAQNPNWNKNIFYTHVE